MLELDHIDDMDIIIAQAYQIRQLFLFLGAAALCHCCSCKHVTIMLLLTADDKLHIEVCTPLIQFGSSTPCDAAIFSCFLIQHPVECELRARSYRLQAAAGIHTTPAPSWRRCGALQLDGTPKGHLNLASV
jgi:hypothetical protein